MKTQDELLANGIADIKTKYPILFQGGAGADTALLALLKEVTRNVIGIAEIAHAESIFQQLTQLAKEDLEGLATKEIGQETLDSAVIDPKGTILTYIAGTWGVALRALEMIAEGKEFVTDDKCDCPHHKADREADMGPKPGSN